MFLTILFVVYVLIGVIFGVYFAFVRAATIDPAAKGGSFFFRFLIFFGSAGLWPVLLRKAFGDSAEPVETNEHRSRTK